MDNNYKKKDISALQAQFEAQKLAFAPFLFQAAKCLMDFGILEYLKKRGDDGASVCQISEKTGLSEYGVQILVDSGLTSDILYLNNKSNYVLSTVGFFLLKDELTRINFEFTNDVCYLGMFHLKDSIKNEKPEGLKVFGKWKTLYEALAHLPENVRKSWFDFDHYYSDLAFDKIAEYVFSSSPETIMDIGANTGKWSKLCMEYNLDVNMILVDLPGQLEVAKANLEEKKLSERATFVPLDILSAEEIGHKADVVWMSQFLDCFSKEEITFILSKAQKALKPGGRILVLETFIDTQKFEASAFCLINISLYFTAMANGNSKMYRSHELIECADKAGLKCIVQKDQIGLAHTLLEFAVE